MAEFMHESIVFCSAFTMSSLGKFTFAISSPDEFLVVFGRHVHGGKEKDGSWGYDVVIEWRHPVVADRSVRLCIIVVIRLLTLLDPLRLRALDILTIDPHIGHRVMQKNLTCFQWTELRSVSNQNIKRYKWTARINNTMLNVINKTWN